MLFVAIEDCPVKFFLQLQKVVEHEQVKISISLNSF